MKFRLYQCCWSVPLRLGSIVIAWYLIGHSLLYLIIFPFRGERGPADKDEYLEKWFLNEYGAIISIASAVFSIVVGMFILIGVYKPNVLCLLISLILFTIYVLAYIGILVWSSILGSIILAIYFVIYVGIHSYVLMVLASYWLELKESQLFRDSLSEEEETQNDH